MSEDIVVRLRRSSASAYMCQGCTDIERDEAADEIERLRLELSELWHFATCPFDHCQRCCEQEGMMKSIRDRMRGREPA